MAGKASVFIDNSAPAVDDDWLNLRQNEVKNLIEAGSLTLNDGVSNQEAIAISNINANGNYYTDTGSANTYVLSVVSPNVAVDRFRDGMKIRFRTNNKNTTASTVDLAGLGVKDIKNQDGISDILAGDISNYLINEIEYNLSQDVWLLKPNTFSLQKYFIYGFVPSSGTDTDEQVDMIAGRGVCEDGSTIVELQSDESDIDFPTLLGGVLGNDTTYHLFRYLKNDFTMQWHLETSLTPTIGDIKSALAYRRILSLKTDSSGDLSPFVGFKKANGLIHIKFDSGINEGSSVQSATKATITLSTIPLGLSLSVDFILNRVSGTGGNRYYALFHPDKDPTVNSSSNDIIDGLSAGNYDNGGRIGFKEINTSSQISHKGTVSGDIGIAVLGYNDYRNYF